MPFDFFLAQTAGELGLSMPKDAKTAWMACHFSPYSTGISNSPRELPPGSMLILNDQIPTANHDPDRIAQQIGALVDKHHCERVLLDFQRPDTAVTAAVTKAIVQTLPCPVGVSALYAQGLPCGVFLPPPPLHRSLEEYIAPWRGRPIWLEIMPQLTQYSITQDGCRSKPLEYWEEFPHFDPVTHCRYAMEILDNAVSFTLSRGLAEWKSILQNHPVDCLVGLYQEFAQPEAQATAFAQ